jgi:ABC-type uncharacterized transport system YnjBCD substrate-binding protein
MKKMMMTLAALMMVGSLAHAADAENKAEATTDTSKNPITGTVTTTKKHSRKMKGAHGEAKAEVTEKTKVHKNGKVEKTEKVDASSEEAAH